MTIKAMKEAVKSTPNLYYFIAGDGPDKRYIKESAKGVKNIVYLGEITDEEKWAWLKVCDIFIMPSRDIDGDFEGFGIVYIEASLMGKPIVAGDTGGVRDAVLGARTGILVDPENENRIAGAITALAQDLNTDQNPVHHSSLRAGYSLRYSSRCEARQHLWNKTHLLYWSYSVWHWHIDSSSERERRHAYGGMVCH